MRTYIYIYNLATEGNSFFQANHFKVIVNIIKNKI